MIFTLIRIAINVEKQSAQAELDYWTQVQQARTKLEISNEELGVNETSEQPNDLIDSNLSTEASTKCEQVPNQ